MGPYNKNRPGCLYEQMVMPIRDYAIKGVLWYQGENDVHHASLYSRLFETLITEWRKIWGQDIPFIFAQLAPFGEWLALDGKLFPEIRMQQEIISKTVPNCYMISTSDVGMRYDIHPKEKKALGHRFFLQAMDKVYGKTCLADAPQLHRITVMNNQIELQFCNAGTGLQLDGDVLPLFEVRCNGEVVSLLRLDALQDSVFLTSSTPLKGTVTVSFVQTPYYEVTLRNSAGLPAVPLHKRVKVEM